MAYTEEFKLYYDAKDDLKNVTVHLTPEQEEQRQWDRDVIKSIDDYYAPYRERWRSNGALFNLIQTGSDDVTSNWYLGWARILINHAMAMMTAADPKGDFEPVGHTDAKMRILVNALVEYNVRKCNWHAHQRLWIQDLLTFGNGTINSYSRLPMKKKKWMGTDGTMQSKIVRNFHKSKVGIERVSPFRTMRSHFIRDPDDVPVSVEVEEGTWNQLAMKYGNAILEDGTKKYDLSQVQIGTHYRIIHFYDENENCYRIYCQTYGNKPEATQKLVYPSLPPVFQLGVPIYNVPLQRYKVKKDEKDFLMGGVNVAGLSPLAFATFDDQLDLDFETYSILGMGIPQIIEGPESVMHGLVNMSIDNERLKSTVPISYQPNNPDSPSALDLDVRTMYSGLVIDGKITAQPLGAPQASANQPLWEWLKFIIYQLSGINPEPLTGDQLHTAYQSGLLVRQMNMRAKARISAWENGPLKRAWTVLGMNSLSECTVEEWEEITEDEAKNIQEMVRENKMTGEDYDDSEKAKGIYKKKRNFMIPVKGHKFREDFTGKRPKKRALNPNDAYDQTLVEDKSMQGNTSYVPASQKYLLPSGSIESVLDYQVTVDGAGMLQDLKLQDMETMQKVIGNIQQAAQLDPTLIQRIDADKILARSIEPSGMTEDDLYKGTNNMSKLATQLGDTVKQAEAAATGQGQPAPNTAGGQTAQAIDQGKIFNTPTAEAGGLFPEVNNLNGPPDLASKFAQGLV